MPRTPYDVRLLEAACSDDRESILSLLVLAQPDLRRYAAQACATSEDVNDAMQEALWILDRRVGTLRTSFSGCSHRLPGMLPPGSEGSQTPKSCHPVNSVLRDESRPVIDRSLY